LKFGSFFIRGKILGDDNDIYISLDYKEDFNRNYLFKLIYQIGTVYEIKNKEFYEIGTSFTRDESHTRALTHKDRIKIMNLKNKVKPFLKSARRFLNNKD
jgi:hypothetical protein